MRERGCKHLSSCFCGLCDMLRIGIARLRDNQHSFPAPLLPLPLRTCLIVDSNLLFSRKESTLRTLDSPRAQNPIGCAPFFSVTLWCHVIAGEGWPCFNLTPLLSPTPPFLFLLILLLLNFWSRHAAPVACMGIGTSCGLRRGIPPPTSPPPQPADEG